MSNQAPRYLNPNLVNIDGVAPTEGELLYTEKVTKTTIYDKDGNVLDIAENVDREPARPGIVVKEHESRHLAPDGTLRTGQGDMGNAASGMMAPGQAMMGSHKPSSDIGAPGTVTERVHGEGVAAASDTASRAVGEVSSSTRKSKITDPGMSL